MTRRRGCLLLITGALVVAGVLRPAPAPARVAPAPFTPRFIPGGCPAVPGVPSTGATLPRRCGSVTVPLDHREPARGTIEVAVGVHPATDPAPGPRPEPLLLLGGGPGDKTLAAFSHVVSVPGSILAGLRRTRELVIIDQRGAGASRPALDCPEETGAEAPSLDLDMGRRLLVEAIVACHARLRAAGIDLSAFSTANNVRDLDLVRRALGHRRWHVFGTSYGARLAWQAARLFPDRLVSLVLSSPIPADENWIADSPASFGDAVRAVVEACAGDAACSGAYPHLAADTDRLVHQVSRVPLKVPVTDPGTRRRSAVRVDDRVLASVLFLLFYAPEGPSLIPQLVTQLARGDVQALSGGSPAADPATVRSMGMQLSFMCAEELAHLDRGELRRNLTRGGSYGRAVWSGTMSVFEQLCAHWPVAASGREVFRPVRSDVPTLVVTGQFDQITPPAYGVSLRRRARHSQHVQVAGAGHSPLLAAGACGVSLLVAFTAAPRAPLDTRCLPERPTFRTAPSGAAGPARSALAALVQGGGGLPEELEAPVAHP